jgi:thiosulfate/3-mercaptopyruvate sulfurtransferase
MNREELLIEADELNEAMANPELRIFDATIVFDPNAKDSAHDLYKKGHIPGAAFIDHSVLSDPNSPLMYMIADESTLASAIGTLGISNDTPVVIYSSEMLAWATRIWWVLRYAGHRDVRVLNGGLEAWKGELEQGESIYEASQFATHLTPSMFASAEDVIAATKDGNTCVVNTLMPEMYAGTVDVPYAGHIPGSVNHPLTDFMNGHYLMSDDDLKHRFKERMTGERLITYCGGGIAATLNACAALVSGVEYVSVYDGSMSQWVAQALPIEKGSEPGTPV